ncbi:MAG: MBL fold metallo-hydrolase [Methylotenera sp.]|nr:MBL fold metallo-hydrolase [Oligoflexia bacterium]
MTTLNLTQSELPGLKQFRAEGCLSYLIYDRATRSAALIDPVLELMDDYRTYLADHRLKLVWALDTHTHADHFSASQEIRNQYDVPIGMSATTECARATHKFKHGEELQVGELTVRVLATPGHTPDSVSYFVSGLVFTGDTLFVGGSGRTDFPGADPAQQFGSIHQVLEKLPGSTLILPGHDYNDYLFSTLEVESRKNPHWLLKDVLPFTELKRSELVNTSHAAQEEIKKRILFNLTSQAASQMGSQRFGAATACGVASKESAQYASINVQKYLPKLQTKAKDKDATKSQEVLFIDVREVDEFAEGHMPETRNIPLSELGLNLPELLKVRRVYVSCLSGRRSSMAAKTLSYLGVEDVVNVTGGYQAWTQAGYPVVKA